MCEQVLGKERNGVIARRGRRGQESLLFFKLGELIAHVHADGSASVQGKAEEDCWSSKYYYYWHYWVVHVWLNHN